MFQYTKISSKLCTYVQWLFVKLDLIVSASNGEDTFLDYSLPQWLHVTHIIILVHIHYPVVLTRSCLFPVNYILRAGPRGVVYGGGGGALQGKGLKRAAQAVSGLRV